VLGECVSEGVICRLVCDWRLVVWQCICGEAASLVLIIIFDI
jgi:hypothetical protein